MITNPFAIQPVSWLYDMENIPGWATAFSHLTRVGEEAHGPAPALVDLY